ncbi:MAG: LytTR family DNA-binding domain-containing protein [Candidatus Kapabacteria bacterium]|jgi:DNA-binding LytR/AlgR family response regulator|nr:LytTR family DNA-binding domain-containing protein [Candidatus Kapabacteria bacterium]
MNVVLIEDEDIAMRKLRSMILAIDRSVTIVAELSSVEEAGVWFRENLHKAHIDLIVSDIQLSDGLVFEIFEGVHLTIPIIFTTAFNEYAIKAFAVHGLDYLLKPIRSEDLKRSLEKFHQNKLLYSGEAMREVQRLLAAMQHTSTLPAPNILSPTFLATSGNRIIPLPAESVAFFFMKNQFVRAMHTNRNDYALDETLEEIEARLPKHNFFRANRQYIISRTAVVSAEPSLGNRLLVRLQPPAQEAVIMSREKVSAFKAWLRGE